MVPLASRYQDDAFFISSGARLEQWGVIWPHVGEGCPHPFGVIFQLGQEPQGYHTAKHEIPMPTSRPDGFLNFVLQEDKIFKKKTLNVNFLQKTNPKFSLTKNSKTFQFSTIRHLNYFSSMTPKASACEAPWKLHLPPFWTPVTSVEASSCCPLSSRPHWAIPGLTPVLYPMWTKG